MVSFLSCFHLFLCPETADLRVRKWPHGAKREESDSDDGRPNQNPPQKMPPNNSHPSEPRHFRGTGMAFKATWLTQTDLADFDRALLHPFQVG